MEDIHGRCFFRWDDPSAWHLLCTLFLFCGNLSIFCLDFRVGVHTPMRIGCWLDGGRAQEVMWAAVNTHEASLAHSLAAHLLLWAWFLTGHGPVLGTSALQAPSSTFFTFKALHLLNQLTYFSPIFHCIPLSRQIALLAKAWKSPPFFSSYVFVISWPPWWLRR